MLSEEERQAWQFRSPPNSARGPLAGSFLGSPAADKPSYLDQLKMDQLRTEVTLLTNELDNITANHVRLEERLRKSRLGVSAAEKRTEEETAHGHKGRLRVLTQSQAEAAQALRAELDAAESAHRSRAASGLSELEELTLFWETRRRRLGANFEESAREQICRLEDEHRQAVEQMEAQVNEARRGLTAADAERRQQTDVAARAQKRLQQLPQQLRRAAEEEHLRRLEDEAAALRQASKANADQLSAQLQGERQEIAGLRQLLRELELSTEARGLLQEAGLDTERRKAQLRGEQQQRGEARLQELGSLRLQLRKDIDKVAGSTAALQESYAEIHADAAKEAECGHLKRLAALRDELADSREQLDRSEAELLMAEETRGQTQKLLRQRFGEDFTGFVEEEISRAGSPAARDCLELILRLERNDSRIAYLQEQLGPAGEFSDAALAAKIQSLQRELREAREVLQGEQVKFKAIREAVDKISDKGPDAIADAKREIIDMLAG